MGANPSQHPRLAVILFLLGTNGRDDIHIVAAVLFCRRQFWLGPL